MSRGQERRRLLPSYLATGSGGPPTASTLDTLTALKATGVSLAPFHTTVHQRVVELLEGGSLTVVEIAGYLDLPVSICIVLAEQLVNDGQLRSSVPFADAVAAAANPGRPSKEVMEEVLSGLRALLV